MLFYEKLLPLIAFFSFSLFLTAFSTIEAQNLNINKFQYLSPVPGSKLNSIETNIIIRLGDAFINNGISNKLMVTGYKSGRHTGKIILVKNNSTILFKPDIEFADGEVVTVVLKGNLRTITNEQVPDLRYSFETSKVNLNKIIRSNPVKYQSRLNPDLEYETNQSNNFAHSVFNPKTYTVQQDSLPPDFPSISVDIINNPTDGKIFLAPYLASNPLRPNFLIVTDNYGIPVFYRKMLTERTLNFVRQNSGVLTYFNTGKYYVMDSSYKIVDSLYMGNGYMADVHECVLLDSGYSLLFSYDYQQVNMDTVISGGDSTATVIGTVIQELDENKNVIFQWRSWDHFKITDATYDIDLKASTIDYVHANALELDDDGNILLSSRNLDEITKIDIETGEIIWRMGGEFCENNQFTFENDPIGFSHQHDIRRLADGRISLFDNGNLHNPQFSRAVEYEIDESNLTATLVWEFKNNPQTFSVAMGNSERLKNDNRVIGWGWTFSPPTINEVTPEGTITFSMSIPEGWVNYRGLKYPWKTNLFVTNPDTLFFEYSTSNDSLVKSLKIINNSTSEIQINRILNRDPSFYVITPLPVTLPVSGSATIQVVFRANDQNEHTDDLYLQWNKKNECIAQVVPLYGTADTRVPVELISFTASVTDQTVTLNWTTVSETNNLGFEIERKTNNKEWITRGFIEGHGTTTEINNYIFKDQVVPLNYEYRLKQIDFNGEFEYSDIIEVDADNPVEHFLGQNYPNPFNPNTKIEFKIRKEGKVSLKVYDIMGKKVKTLIDKKIVSGSYKINFDGSNLPSGVYIYTLSTNDYTDSKKMILLK